MRPFICFDIETAPSPRALALPPNEEFLGRGIRENFKPETVQSYRERNAEEWPDEIAKRGALDWRMGTIVAAGTAQTGIVSGVPEVQVILQVAVPPEDDTLELAHKFLTLNAELGLEGARVSAVAVPGERSLLQRTWGRLDPGHPQLSGFYIRTFDLPWLLGRTAAQGLLPPRRFSSSRYVHEDVADWADILAWYDAFPRTGWTLTDYADWFDLRYKPWGEGSQIPGWLEDRDYLSIAKHLAFDLLTSHALHERFAPVYLH